ncbi:META domain-containing protein [Psychrobacter sp. DAB_AL62B]|uniref:META domain-containing protein n=1 Tax=Psychrobacter sp. DAB_AL62B TaxID=1028420 RepID=UPI0023814CB8|nr:META domain-containing protein [Psychrobacter sp. DAB_AL62B]MDE4454932.1 META domain-containing protein [Psychrobacter sp. DAB_AL62B]
MTFSCHLLIPARTLTFISMLGVTGLVSCQSIDSNTFIPITAKAPKPVDTDEKIITFPQSEDNEYIGSWKLPELPVESLNRFDWKLVRWIDNQDIVTYIDSDVYAGGNTVPPLMLDVRPSNLVFKYDCQRYSLHHDGYHDYTYSSYGVTTTTPASCLINDTQAASDVSDYLTQLFPKYGRGRFNLKVISTPKQPPSKQQSPKLSSSLNKTTSKQSIPYELALNAQDKQFIFEGTPKKLQSISGLPISYEFLKTYQWRLVSAVDSNNKAIIEVSRPGFPVSAYFGYPIYNEEHHVGFSSDCNGVGGPYILTADNILLIGSGAQTMMGCGPKREAAEDKIRELEQLSKSQLTLQQLSNTNVDNPSLPYYLLTQKLDTGETLIWKNEKTVTR